MAPARKTAKKTATKKTAAKKAPARKAPAKKKAVTKKKAAPKKAATKKKAATPAVTTLKHIAATMAEEHEMPKRQVETILSEFVDHIGANLKKGAKIRIAGLGILQVRHRPARMGRNPATGESIRIKASKKVAFRVAKDLKESI